MSLRLSEKLFDFLQGNEYEEFRSWCIANKELVISTTNQGTYLHLKNGDRAVARAVLQRLSPCRRCSELPRQFPGGHLYSPEEIRPAFYLALETLNSATEQGVLQQIAGGFKCCTCGAVRKFELPEREFTGEIKTVS